MMPPSPSRRAALRVLLRSLVLAAPLARARPTGATRNQHRGGLRITHLVADGDERATAAADRGAALATSEARRLAALLGWRFDVRSVRVRSGAAGNALRPALEPERPAAYVAAIGEGELARELHAIDPGIVVVSAVPVRREVLPRSAFSIAPDSGRFVDALSAWLPTRRSLSRWLFLTAETEGSRRIRERARVALVARGGQDVGALALGDARRLSEAVERSRAELVFAAVERLSELRPLESWSGPAVAPVPLAPEDEAEAGRRFPRLFWAVTWHPRLVRYGAGELNERFEKRFRRPMDSLAWTNWMAVKVIADSFFRGGSTDLAGALRERGFDGHKGRRLSFRNGVLEQPVYVIGPDARPGRFDVLGEA